PRAWLLFLSSSCFFNATAATEIYTLSLHDALPISEGKQFDLYLKRLENSSVGKKAPDIRQLTPEGERFSLSDLRGKYVLIEFWASWCPDCRKANPNLVKTYNTFKDKNFEILGVSFDRKYEDWVAAIEKDKLDWKH